MKSLRIDGFHTETPLDAILDHVGGLKTTLWSGAPVSHVADLFPELRNCEVIFLQVKPKLWSLRLLLSTGCAACHSGSLHSGELILKDACSAGC